VTSPFHILLADDSLVMRRLLEQSLQRHADLIVTGMARSGQEALDLLPHARPDVVLLDVEMPGMNGVQTAAALRKIDRRLPIIMFSALTVQGAGATLDALNCGANDYVTKPQKISSREESLRLIDQELVTRIRQWGALHRRSSANPAFRPISSSVSRPASPLTAPLAVSRPVPRPHFPPEIVVIGVSTGGPTALSEVLPVLPANFPVPVLVVQHMPAVFTRLLADRLNQSCPCTVREAVSNAPLTPGTILIAPGDYHLSVVSQAGEVRTHLSQGPAVNSCRPAVDVLFQSVAPIYGPAVLSVILTGMGKDGLDGARGIKALGGQLLVQDQASSVVWGMPRAVTEAGLADQILPLSAIGAEIVNVVHASRRVFSRQGL